MSIARTFFTTLILFLLVWVLVALDSPQPKVGAKPALEAKLELELIAAASPAVQAQVAEIDREIAELQAMKRGFQSRALRHEDQAQRLQFEDRAVLETKRHLELADENREKAARIQQEIDRLEEEKSRLLQRS